MVAPVLIAGLGVIASGIANAVLGKKGPVYFVVRLVKGLIQDGTVADVAGKPFTSIDDAEAWQEKLSRNGQGSILVQRATASNHRGRTYTALHPVQAMAPAKVAGTLGASFAIAPPGYWIVKWRAPGSTKEHIEVFQWEREAAERERDLIQMAAFVSKTMVPFTKRTSTKKKMGSFHPPLDTKDQQEQATLLTTRFTTPERFERARTGPYPETENWEPQKLTLVPEFDDTTSSHEWKSSVVPAKVPGYDDSTGHSYKKQPEILDVDHLDQEAGDEVPVKPW